jgi:hypothetical protein
MIRAQANKLSLYLLLAATCFGQLSAQTPRCTSDWLKGRNGLILALALLCPAALAAKPTQGDHALSPELFFKEPATWFRNAFGWRAKAPRIKSINEETGMPIYKAGYDGQGFVGSVEELGKTLAPFAGLALFVKALDPLCWTFGTVKDALVRDGAIAA